MLSRSRRERRPRPGAFVVVVGPDGVGKTTLARALVDAYPGPTGYFHFRPPLRGPLPERPIGPGIPPPDKGAPGGSRLLGWLRLARSFLWFWAAHLVAVGPAVRSGRLVVGDRWAYGYLVQPLALKFYGPPWLASAALRALPTPDLVVNLIAPVDVIRRRKQELEPSQIREELARWEALPVARLRTFSAVEAPEELAAAVLEELAR